MDGLFSGSIRMCPADECRRMVVAVERVLPTYEKGTSVGDEHGKGVGVNSGRPGRSE